MAAMILAGILVTPDQIFHHHFDVDNAPSQDDNESASNSSTRNTSFLEIKVWQKIQRKQVQYLNVMHPGRYQMLRHLSLPTSVQPGSSTTTAKISHLGGGVISFTAHVGQSGTCLGAFHTHHPYNQDNGDGSDDDGEQSHQSYLVNTFNDIYKTKIH